LSNHWLARLARTIHRLQSSVSVPLPVWFARLVFTPFTIVRSLYHFTVRVFLAEPFFRMYCTTLGNNFHTGAHLHWVQGRGQILIGDNVTIDGKCSFFFAVRYSESPTLRIGNNTGIGHSCAFTVGREIAIGEYCRIGGGVTFFDAPGHPTEPISRQQGKPANPADVRPIIIGDNVWIGSWSVIMPGVTIGDNSVVGLGSVVMSSVPANVIVAGNPARQIGKIPVPEDVPATTSIATR
jgi:acetyltransferase-like isoleucine patch superfamily enzyme